MNPATETCLYCNEKIRGRSDKKFCDDGCRNSYNNEKRARDRGSVQQIIKTLQKNRNILKDLLQKDRTKNIDRDELLRRGYDFRYHTHHFVNNAQTEYIFCFDYGFKEAGRRLTVVQAFAGM